MTCFQLRGAAAIPDEMKIQRIADSSAINPSNAGPGLGGGLAHIKWLAHIARDCAEMAAITDEANAHGYALVAQAANLQAQKLSQKMVASLKVETDGASACGLSSMTPVAPLSVTMEGE